MVQPLVTAMVLAAGKGSRLRPLTDTTPKPLINVAGRPVLLRTLDYLQAVGIQRVVINTHYLGQMVEDTVSQYIRQKRAAGEETFREVHFSREEMLLETGGGLKKALPLLGDKPFLVVNSDAVWNEYPSQGGKPLLKPFMEAFNPALHDCLLAVVPQSRTVRAVDHGDFYINPVTSVITRPADFAARNVMYTGLQIMSPALVMSEPAEVFSNNVLWDKIIPQNRLHGWVYDAPWVEMDTVEGLEKLRAMFAGLH